MTTRTSRRRPAQPSALDGLAAFDDDGRLVVVVETPKGSPNKLAFEPRYGTFVLKACCARPIGVIEAEQTENGRTERNDRLLAVADNSATHRSIRQLNDLSPDLVGQIEHFFVSYNEAKGKRFVVKRRAGRQRALALVARAQRARRR